MPYCDEHNEVYRDEECPICAGNQPENTDRSENATATDRENESVDAIVSDAIEAAEEDLDVSGDVVEDSQEKSVETSYSIEIDQSETKIDEGTEIHDDSTTIKDSVVNRSDIGDGNGGAEVEDSVINRSDIEGGTQSSNRSGETGGNPKETTPADGIQGQSESINKKNTVQDNSENLNEVNQTKYCIYCQAKILQRAKQCPSCGENLEIDTV